MLRTFTIFMKPVELWEHLALVYCAGPSIRNSATQVRGSLV